MLSGPPSVELSVEAILCFDGDLRRKLEGRGGAARLGLRFADFVDELEPAHNRPRNLDAAACRSGMALIFAAESPLWASLKLASNACRRSQVTTPVSPTKSLTKSSALYP